jgi:hypothetical protein
MFATQILPTDNLKGLKPQPTTSRHQKQKELAEWNYSVPICFCSSQNKTDHINSTYQTNAEAGRVMENHKHSTRNVFRPN